MPLNVFETKHRFHLCQLLITIPSVTTIAVFTSMTKQLTSPVAGMKTVSFIAPAFIESGTVHVPVQSALPIRDK